MGWLVGVWVCGKWKMIARIDLETNITGMAFSFLGCAFHSVAASADKVSRYSAVK